MREESKGGWRSGCWLFLAGLSMLHGACALAQEPGCGDGGDLLFVNGRIHTMDRRSTVVETVHIVGDRFAEVGGETRPGPCTRTVDLEGRTAIPGIIDNHNHIILLGLRPGHDTRLENLRSMEALLDAIGSRAAALPRGEWISAIGGFHISQFTPAPDAPRFPTLDELDRAAPDHPVYIQQGFAGPAVTNSAGKDFLESKGIAVGEDGLLAGGATPNPSTQALFALRQLQTPQDRERGLLDALAYGAALGITTHLDQGGFPSTGGAADGAAHFDPATAYDPVLALHAMDKLDVRLRLNFLYMESEPGTPRLRARLENAFPAFGDSMLRVLGIGEFTAGASPILGEPSDVWMNGTRRVAEAGWRNENHSLTATDFRVIIDGWAEVNAELEPPGITGLGWVLAHAPFITPEYVEKLDALGGGVSVLGGWRWISGTSEQNGPPFRMLVDSGIPVGMSSDGMQIAPMNPWLGIYYAVTGVNARGELINAGQTVSREEALRLYTAANGWFLGEEDRLGSIEAGKYADLVVLDRDFFDAAATSDEDIRDIRSLLTVVGGRVVHGDAQDL